MLGGMPYRVSPEEFEQIAVDALDTIPAALRERLEADNLMITIQDAATAGDHEDGIDRHVLGYYQGGEDSVFAASPYPKRIVLLQRNIENICRSRSELVAEVHDTVLHEVAHYFGMSHRDLERTRLRH